MINSLIIETKKWANFPLEIQIANIGTDVLRAIKWRKKDKTIGDGFYYQALDLLNLSKEINKHKSISRLKELCRLYEVLVDYFSGNNIYQSSDKLWQTYFNFFLLQAAKKRSLSLSLNQDQTNLF